MKRSPGVMSAGFGLLLAALVSAATGLVATVAIGPATTGVVVDPVAHRAFVVTYSSPGRLVAVDTISHQVLASAGFPAGSMQLDVNPTTGRVYVQVPSQVLVYDGATLGVLGVLPYSDQAGLAVDSSANTLFMADSFGTVRKIDGSTHALLQTTSVAGCADAIDVNAVTGFVYVASYCAGRVTVLDGGSLAWVASVPMPTPYRVAVNESTNRVYVSNIEANAVTVLNGSTGAQVAVIGVGLRPVGVAVDAGHDRVWVANYGGDTVSIIDGATNAVVETVALGGAPYGVSVDTATARAWVASYGAGTVSVLDPSPIEPPPPDTTPPVVVVPGDITAEAASGAGAVVTFTATASDDVDGELTPACSPESGSMFALGVTIVTCTATDAAGNSASASFNVQVVVTVETVEAAIRGWVSNAGVANSLIVKLRHGSFGAFRNEVRALSGKRLTPAQAADLLLLVSHL